MIAEFKAFFTAFQQGKELTHSATWKNRQAAGNAVTALLASGVVIAKGFGFDLAIDEQTLTVAGMGIAALVTVANSILTVVTSAKVGRPPKG